MILVLVKLALLVAKLVVGGGGDIDNAVTVVVLNVAIVDLHVVTSEIMNANFQVTG